MQNARVSATGAWTFEIGSEFELLDNGDSVQALHGDRVVFVSSLRVGTSEAPVPAAEVRSAAAKRLRSGEHLSHVGLSVQGDAEVRPDGDTWRLDGTMCADGTVATCVIEFLEGDQPWAVSVWRSLRCGSEVA